MNKRHPMTTVHSFDEVPAFQSEAEEAAFWSTHQLGPSIIDQMGPIPEDEIATDPTRKPQSAQRAGRHRG